MKVGTTKSTNVSLKASLKDNKTGSKKETKPPTKTALAKKEKPAESIAKPQITDVTNTSEEKQEFSKSTELRFDFIQAIQTQEYDKALKLAEEIKKIEPNNELIAKFQEFLNQNIQTLNSKEPENDEEEKDEESESDEESSQESDLSESDEDDDEDEKEEENEREPNGTFSEASTADQTQRSINN